MSNKRFNVFQNYLGNWIVEDRVADKLLLNIPFFIGFDDEKTACFFADYLNQINNTNNDNSDSSSNKQYLYILSMYEFYESTTILMVSHDYDKVKSEFDALEKEKYHGYEIKRIPVDKFIPDEYPRKDIETLNWIEVKENGKIVDLANLN